MPSLQSLPLCVIPQIQQWIGCFQTSMGWSNKRIICFLRRGGLYDDHLLNKFRLSYYSKSWKLFFLLFFFSWRNKGKTDSLSIHICLSTLVHRERAAAHTKAYLQLLILALSAVISQNTHGALSPAVSLTVTDHWCSWLKPDVLGDPSQQF